MFRPSNRYFLRRFIFTVHSSFRDVEVLFIGIPYTSPTVTFHGTVVLYVLQVQAHSNAWTRGNPRRVLPFIVLLSEILCVLLAESRLYYLRTLAEEKRIARVQRYVFWENRGRMVQVGTGRRTITRARDSPSYFIHACLVNFRYTVRITWRTFIWDLAWLTRFDREYDRSVEFREKKEVVDFLSLSPSPFFSFERKRTAAPFWLAKGLLQGSVRLVRRHSQKVKDCIRCIVQVLFPNISDIQAAILSQSWSQFFSWKRLRVTIMKCNKSFCS